jgi:aldehyde dehydrogenase (NAD+)
MDAASHWTLPAAGLVIGDARLDTGSGGVHKHRFPGTGEAQATVPIAGAAEVDRAVAAAKRAFVEWRATRPTVRRDLLMRLADLVEAHGEEFAWIGAREVGSPIAGLRAIPPKFAAWTRYAAGWADKLEGRVVSTFQDDNVLDYTLAEPYGVIGIIIPWNGPLMGLGMKIGPALAAGNTVVIKPPEQSPFTAWRMIQLAGEAGIPPGVINLVTGGAEAGEALVTHPDIAKVTFTGGLATARRIAGLLAPAMKPAIYELGGKSANIVFADADLDAAARFSARQPLFLAGQGCSLPTRLLVEESIAGAFTERVVAEIASLRIGDPREDTTELGPVIDARAQRRLIDTIEAARARGDGRLALGGGRPAGHDAGYFVAPSVFADVAPDAPIAQEECFGPVLSIIPFRDEDDAVRIANATPYGLAAYIQTGSLKRATRLPHRIEAGTVQVNGAPTVRENAPFGGIGASGYGREGGFDGLREFIRTKNVAIG